MISCVHLGRPTIAGLTKVSMILMLVENNDPFDTVVYKGGNNGEGSEEGIEEQQQHRFQNPTPVQNNSQLTTSSHFKLRKTR